MPVRVGSAAEENAVAPVVREAAYSPPAPLVFVTADAKAASMLSLDAAGSTKAAKQG
jgi:hypothetical protein